MKSFKHNLAYVLLSVALVGGRAFALEGNPMANAEAVVVNDEVRITVLTPGLLRLEWAQEGKFEDRASLTFINRDTEVPRFTTSRGNGILEIKTDWLLLKYRIGSGRFSKENISIDLDAGDLQKTWHFGDVDDGNLLGTSRTLDKCNGSWHATHKEEIELCQG
ncbi:MAG: hypothetical protein DRR04_13965, partial [Gammaproteobacteria bacterium]